MPALRFDATLPPGFELRSAGFGPQTTPKVHLTDMSRRPLPTATRWAGWPIERVRGRWLELETEAPPPYIVRAVIGSALGDLDVAIDNRGAGYYPQRSAPNLLIEAIHSRLERVRRRLDGAGLHADAFAGLGTAREALARGDFANAFLLAIKAGDDVEYQASRQALTAAGRRTLFSGTLCFGERLGGWAIGVGPDWPAGAEPPDFARPLAEREALLPVCEAMTLPNFWRWIEPEQGRYRWGVLDEMLEWAEAHGVIVKSFAIFWLGIGSVPRWLRDLTYAAQLKAIEGWTRALVERYRGHISAWETVNENHDWFFGNPFGWARGQRLEAARMVNELVGALDPGTPRVVNNCQIWGEYAAELESRVSWLPSVLPPAVDSPLTFTEYLIEQGVPFEGIGLQYYLPGRDLLECADQLDRFLALGKEVWVTEMGTTGLPLGDAPLETGQVHPGAGWRGPWSEALQADWVRMWYTIASSRTGVRALNYWDLTDGRAFIEGAGVLRRDGTPKPAFDAVVALREQAPLRPA